MTNFIKHIIKKLDEPLTFEIKVELNLEATFETENPVVSPGEAPNSVKITLNLCEVSNTPSIFSHTFLQELREYDDDVDITILIILNNANGPIITHQESGGHEERPGGFGTA